MNPSAAEDANATGPRQFRLKHSPELDGLRGIAILLVVIHHFFEIGNGALGVDLFFVLSGFLITLLLSAEFQCFGEIKLSYFYMRRVLRLLPALALTLLGLLIGEHLGLVPFPKGVVLYIATYTTNLGILLGNIHTGLRTNPLTPTWSLAIEEQFYIVWPLAFLLLCKLCKGRYPIRGLLGMLLAWEGYRWWVIIQTSSARRLYYGTDTHAHLLFIGCLLAFIRLEMPVRSALGRREGLFWNLFTLLLAGLVLFAPSNFDLYNLLNTLWGIAFAGTIWATTLPLEGYRKVLRWPWLQFLGRISYGLYLFHIPIMVACESVVAQQVAADVLAFPIAIVVSWLSFRGVELPILRYKTRFQRTLRC